ncbi:unnamed protein product [Clonostachys byssicola]|uniref:Uncharacterized protein n=1 Tax=Clonostachys byssicola TaxID=160290 RepID=A0A9N9U5U7_9HYPO|nr:unnamed protein product [Clonostachys byssicola]
MDESVLKDLWIDNDEGPFKSSSYTLIFRGSGRKSVRVDTGDRDIILCVSADETATRLLHLQNVRNDTVDEAKAAIAQLLDELKSQDVSRNERHLRPGYLKVEHVIDDSHEAVRQFLFTEAKKRSLGITWDEGGYSRSTLRRLYYQLWFKVRVLSDGSWMTDSGTRFQQVKDRGTSQNNGNDSHHDV